MKNISDPLATNHFYRFVMKATIALMISFAFYASIIGPWISNHTNPLVPYIDPHIVVLNINVTRGTITLNNQQYAIQNIWTGGTPSDSGRIQTLPFRLHDGDNHLVVDAPPFRKIDCQIHVNYGYEFWRHDTGLCAISGTMGYFMKDIFTANGSFAGRAQVAFNTVNLYFGPGDLLPTAKSALLASIQQQITAAQLQTTIQPGESYATGYTVDGSVQVAIAKQPMIATILPDIADVLPNCGLFSSCPNRFQQDPYANFTPDLIPINNSASPSWNLSLPLHLRWQYTQNTGTQPLLVQPMTFDHGRYMGDTAGIWAPTMIYDNATQTWNLEKSSDLRQIVAKTICGYLLGVLFDSLSIAQKRGWGYNAPQCQDQKMVEIC